MAKNLETRTKKDIELDSLRHELEQADNNYQAGGVYANDADYNDHVSQIRGKMDNLINRKRSRLGCLILTGTLIATGIGGGVYTINALKEIAATGEVLRGVQKNGEEALIKTMDVLTNPQDYIQKARDYKTDDKYKKSIDYKK